jgi:hypothetical protein
VLLQSAKKKLKDGEDNQQTTADEEYESDRD